MKFRNIGIASFFVVLGLVVVLNVAKAEDRERMVQVKEKIETKFEKNKDIRNTRIEERKDIRASTTEKIKEMRGEIRDMRASTTDKFKILKNEKGEILKKIQLNSYEMRRQALIRELNSSVNNLTKISSEITKRIEMWEGKGRDMTKARADLVIANDKIAKAKVAIETFTNLPTPSLPNPANSTTTEVNLEKPRKVGDDAIKSVKDARDALKIVLKTIASVRPVTSTSTSPIISTTTPTTSTSTQ
jgi:hypothetical protein